MAEIATLVTLCLTIIFIAVQHDWIVHAANSCKGKIKKFFQNLIFWRVNFKFIFNSEKDSVINIGKFIISILSDQCLMVLDIFAVSSLFIWYMYQERLLELNRLIKKYLFKQIHEKIILFRSRLKFKEQEQSVENVADRNKFLFKK